MLKPYLIQSARFANNPNQQGIDIILDFNYMGSAEFEFGALPKSLKRVRENIDQYRAMHHKFDEDHGVTIFCKESQMADIPQVLQGLSKRLIRLKESCDLARWVEGDERFRISDFWWDIGNDWFFWKDDPSFDFKFFELLKGVKK